jgi:hypothetical protein
VLREVLPEEQRDTDTPNSIQPEKQRTDSSSPETVEIGEGDNVKTSEAETAEIVSLDRFRNDLAPKP